MTERKEDMIRFTKQERVEMLARIGFTEEQLAANRTRQLAHADESDRQAEQIEDGYYHRRGDRFEPAEVIKTTGKCVFLRIGNPFMQGRVRRFRLDQFIEDGSATFHDGTYWETYYTADAVRRNMRDEAARIRAWAAEAAARAMPVRQEINESVENDVEES
jgi:hypothetical protein